MEWSWLSRVRGAGLLAEPALAFARRELGSDPGQGAPCLLALARSIDAFASRDASAQDEARFVEGAGALLGVVVLAHVGDGEHESRDGVHRVRLGRAGFFDPFAAIARALEEGPAKSLLVEATRMAELEARGAGPISRVALAFESALAAHGDARTITRRFDRAVFLGDVEVDLTRTIEATIGESDAVLARSVLKLVEMLPGGRGSQIDRAEADVRLLPRLVGSALELPASIAVLPLVSGVRVALVLAYEGRSRFVSSSELDRWGLAAADALAQAIANLASRARPARIVPVETDHGRMLMSRTGDGLDSARLLLPNVRATLARELGEPFLVAVPHRDVLFACASGVDALAAVLEQRVSEDAARAPHAISAHVFAMDAGGTLAPRRA